MEITSDLIDYLQKLGRIRLSEEDKQKTMKDLGSIMGYIDKLNELDTTGVGCCHTVVLSDNLALVGQRKCLHDVELRHELTRNVSSRLGVFHPTQTAIAATEQDRVCQNGFCRYVVVG